MIMVQIIRVASIKGMQTIIYKKKYTYFGRFCGHSLILVRKTAANSCPTTVKSFLN